MMTGGSLVFLFLLCANLQKASMFECFQLLSVLLDRFKNASWSSTKGGCTFFLH